MLKESVKEIGVTGFDITGSSVINIEVVNSEIFVFAGADKLVYFKISADRLGAIGGYDSSPILYAHYP